MMGTTFVMMFAVAADGWTIHTEAALTAELQAACTRAVPARKPVLLGFSAPWCLDCKVLHKLETDPKVAAELKNWERVVTDVGRFERHAPLLRTFGGDRIAWWAALQPTEKDCTQPVTTWKRLRTGGIEPASGKTVQSADDLVQWLVDARTKGATPASIP
ncbi:MAG: hypothetical protein CL927_10015 [Deltaproteobacteria bacterium]|nr:hypothetical protein [Deltaproteobacteria bacterium]